MSNKYKINSVRYPDSKQVDHEHRLTKALPKAGLWMSLLVALLTACSSTVDSKVDRSFISDDPCAAPCWYGLTLDESTEADVLTTLATLEFVDPASVRKYITRWLKHDNAQEIQFGCLHPATDVCGGATLVDDRLKSLWVAIGYELSIGEVVTKLGEPDYVEFHTYHADVGGCVVKFAWPTREIAVQFFDTRNETICQGLRNGNRISPDISITNAFYLTREAIEVGPGGCCTRIDWPGLTDP